MIASFFFSFFFFSFLIFNFNFGYRIGLGLGSFFWARVAAAQGDTVYSAP